MRPKGFIGCNKKVRIVFLIVSMASMIIYLLFVFRILGIVSFYNLPVIYLLTYLELLAVVMGVSFYEANEKQDHNDYNRMLALFCNGVLEGIYIFPICISTQPKSSGISRKALHSRFNCLWEWGEG